MSMKDKKVKSVVESDDENEQGACGVSNDPRRFSLAVPEPTPGNQLEESVDNLSMEVHLGGDSSRHPSEISSVSYQNLLDDGEPSNSIISRRGSDDSLDSYPPDFPDAELPPDDLETFEASDLPLSEHFPMGAIQGADSREKSRGDRSSYVSDNSSNLSHHNVRLKDQPPSDTSENIKLREKNMNEPIVDTDEANAKRSSLEIRNNIPVIGEVKDYEKELNIDFNRVQGHKSTVTGLKQSPGVARRVDIETHMERDSSGTDDIGKQGELSASGQQHPNKLRSKKTYSKSKENVIEVITPIPRNINVENEYDYVKYARVQQGNSYVGMRLAYSSSSDSLNIKQGVFSEDNSREPSPEKNLQQKILSDNGSQDKVCEETLMEIPLNSNYYTEDKKAFTLSPENTECDSVEVESVTSEGDNSTPGFPTLEDGLSSSQASDVDEGGSGVGNDHSPSKLIKSKQKAAIEQDILKDDEDCRPKDMDAQAIMNDLKMKREALDMAIADIKTAIQRSKSMSLESAYPSQTEPEGTQPVWVKRVNKEAANLAQRRQEEMRRVQEEIERQQEELAPSQGKTHQVIETCDAQDDITLTQQHFGSADTQWQNVTSETLTCTDETCIKYDSSFIPQTEIVKHLSDKINEQVSYFVGSTPQTIIVGSSTNELNIHKMDHKAMIADHVQLIDKPKHLNEEHNLYSMQHCRLEQDSSCMHKPVSSSLSSSLLDRRINVNSDTEIQQSTTFKDLNNAELHDNCEYTAMQAAAEFGHFGFEDGKSKDVLMNSDIYKDFPKEEEKCVYFDSTIQTVPNNVILSFGSWGLESTKIDNKARFVEHAAVKQHIPTLAYQVAASNQLCDHIMQEDEGPEADSYFLNESKHLYTEETISENMTDVNYEGIVPKSPMDFIDDGDCEYVRHREHTAEEVIVREETEVNCATIEADDGLVGSVRLDGLRRGYDSDDECEDAEGIRYTRRIKGKKYAPLQIDDSLEMGEAYTGSGRDVSRSNGHMLSNKHGSHSGSNGSLVSHKQPQSQSGEHHIHSSEAPLSSEENSDIDANITSYTRPPNADSDTDEETDRLLQKQYQERDKNVEIPELSDPTAAGRRSEAEIRHSKAKEAAIRDPDRPEVLIEGVLFRARYLGSTQLISEGQPSKAMRMMQAQEAVGRIKTLGVLHFGERFQAPEGENQPSTDVDLFVSTEKIMVLNTDLQEIMMDHSLRTISYIADIGDILVIMARRRLITSPDDMLGRRRRQAKILCHVFESDEAQLIAQSIGQAFQVAYLEFLKANGIEDPGLLKEMDYQDVLNQQEIYGEELNLFANKDFHKEVIVPKSKNEPLGVVIVESGWGSMVPTVVLANMLPAGPAARCGQLNIGDQIISINGISLVGLPLSACQTYIKASRSQTVVKLTVVPCPPVVEVLIKRPDVKYQLGFSVQNGVICSLLRGGIAERGGVRVGHRIIEINNQSVVAVPHEKIVTLLASSVGEIHMKTMPTSIFRLLTGQDVPHYL